MSFFGYATFHGLVMRMFTGVVVNLERCRCKGFDNLAAQLELVHNPYCLKALLSPSSASNLLQVLST